MGKLFRNDNLGKLILRVTVGVLILFHGVHKILNPGSLDFISKQLSGINLPHALAYGVYVGEVIAPLMIIFGIFSRLGGLLIFGNMVFALVLAHRSELFTLTGTGGWALELQGFYLFSGLAVLFLGSGRIAIKPD
ncbi:putative oxidoreductase [Nitrosospira briensis]|uniref:Putative oxidoreductase n=1 Tax=Nitrosospira briensis TaxID=35799 RepID=A0A1I4Z1B8_9PROT|nr:DoxX family protein [Nitrosospira briensis]SFN43967.1 putative oxidoreductase [Nitrosospira briensis]